VPHLSKLRDAVDAMVRVLVCDVDLVQVKLTRGDVGATLHITTTERDLGIVIGKQGRTVTALRTLIQAASWKNGSPILVDVTSRLMSQPLASPVACDKIHKVKG
jgi:predicted RNA-binding protein YlqC (UPF0109 family)